MAGTKKSGFKNDLLKLIFQNTNIANIGDGTGLRGSSVAGDFYIALYGICKECLFRLCKQYRSRQNKKQKRGD